MLQCDENTNVTTATCASCDKDNHVTLTNGCKKGRAAIGAGDSPFIIRTKRGQQKICESCSCDSQRQESKETIMCRSDCGYSSGHECCDSCSVPSSNDGSDVACLEGMCNHEGKLANIGCFPDYYSLQLFWKWTSPWVLLVFIFLRQ